MGNFGTFLGPMFFAFGLFTVGFALGRGSYAFLMRAMFDLPNGQILKNANGMSALRGGRGLAADRGAWRRLPVRLQLFPVHADRDRTVRHQPAAIPDLLSAQ